MIERQHSGDGRDSRAVYSDCGAYRYALTRRWGPGAALVWVMLNPSTATEAANDPTIERVERRSRMLGYDALSVVNLFAWRATRPADLARAGDPVGPDNDAVILETVAGGAAVLCAWGVHGALHGRDAVVRGMLAGSGQRLLHLGLTAGGAPRHPLYVAYARAPELWRP
ncbi:MAG: DUF1643 domain-containing protein [Paracoccus sp. (in: a-proteobacteria)]|uniref:DUF1643 domain-containing protein n=1 Tax=Paracoccus sp. TaxID=267 RepID=UPI0026DFAFD4|nr:DUF1643 domain-containing protein [Paracoccus sp. (in: a-proteobacteria)]MDO5613249.1 DUF1643 domain-containing protein [Paracoccus sp. (in: a-proteobacteria)]